jgi:hypothetical protein
MTNLRILFFMSGLVALGGCSSIARTTSSKEAVRIEIGKTNKRDILDLLGLPNRNERHEIDGRPTENWIYFKQADQTVVVVSGPNGATAQFVKNQITAPRRDIAIIVTFVGSDVVADVANFLEKP